jgi:hypothetical protein
MTTSPTTSDLVAIALAYDAEPFEVREQVAAWLRSQGAYARGVAEQLLNGPTSCPHCKRARGASRAAA